MTVDETKSVQKSVSIIIQHDQYISGTFQNDFSLIKLSSKIDFDINSHIRPSCLPADDSATYENYIATVTGWGTTSSGGSASRYLRYRIAIRLKI